MQPVLTGLKRSDAGVRFTWSDELSAVLSPWQLRVHCPCALCVSEVTGKRMLDPGSVPIDLALSDMQPVGQYAYRGLFGDQHDTGIYTIETLRGLCEAVRES